MDHRVKDYRIKGHRIKGHRIKGHRIKDRRVKDQRIMHHRISISRTEDQESQYSSPDLCSRMYGGAQKCIIANAHNGKSPLAIS